jgi:hypothetical protein
MHQSVIDELIILATTQGRPPPLHVITTFEGLTANMEPRRANPFARYVCFHETATADSVSAVDLLRRHQSRAIGTSWNGIIGHLGDFYSYVPVRTHMAWAQGTSAVEVPNDWDSIDCKIHMYSLEVCGLNNGTPVRREQLLAIVQFMWYADQFLGIPIADWRNRYFTHAGIGRFKGPPPYPHQPHGRKTDPRGYNPFLIVQDALGTSPGTAPQTGKWKVVISGQNANVRRDVHIGSQVIDQVPNGREVIIVEWRQGDPVTGNPWWGRRAEGGWMSQTVIQLVTATPPLNVPHIGQWWVNVSSRNANVRSDHRSEAPIIATMPNKSPVAIVEWARGDSVSNTNWWGKRAQGGWMSITVLSATNPALATTFSDRMAARATRVRAAVLPSWDANGPIVRCNLDDEDDHDHQ